MERRVYYQGINHTLHCSIHHCIDRCTVAYSGHSKTKTLLRLLVHCCSRRRIWQSGNLISSGVDPPRGGALYAFPLNVLSRAGEKPPLFAVLSTTPPLYSLQSLSYSLTFFLKASLSFLCPFTTLPQLDSVGSAVSFISWVWGGAPAKMEFAALET